MHLVDIQHDAWDTARTKGLHDNLNSLPYREQTLIRLALVMTEVAEATQIVKRHGTRADVLPAIAEELADVIIRCADLAQTLRLDLDEAVSTKLATNRLRPYRFGIPGEQPRPLAVNGTTPPVPDLAPYAVHVASVSSSILTIEEEVRFYPCTKTPCDHLGTMHHPETGHCLHPGCSCHRFAPLER